ncbi:ParB/RepB/Spo0J family partition protein [Novosphingobium resinovorum]|uniref:ParB/RepB/Spo0J family partition protein n=1 Tax=Novosphingobium TaxID=165696 RepID=UPI00259FF832|nr:MULTISPECIES: ParB/RepB/Spo0J family partition protein [Novosphingobium]WJM26306.1 ParB/RepB/Spo0J family partition protein [Novosphingobium resinovorum]
MWDGNPRDVPGLSAESCRSLIESIAQEDGNRIPVLVRHNAPGADCPYELLVGSRRRFCVEWLNNNGRPEIRLNAMIVDLTDEEAFRLADIENREREDITELDRARSYQSAVDRFYGGVQSRMAEALNLSNSQLSRLLSLAQMPDEVVDAFATREELRVRHSEVLTPLLRRAEQRERVLVAARAIGQEQQRFATAGEKMISAATVLSRLKHAAGEGVSSHGSETVLMVGDARVGRVRSVKDGLSVELTLSLDADIDQALAIVREAVLDSRARLAREIDAAAD